MNEPCPDCLPKWANNIGMTGLRLDPNDSEMAFFGYRCGTCRREWETHSKLIPDEQPKEFTR